MRVTDQLHVTLRGLMCSFRADEDGYRRGLEGKEVRWDWDWRVMIVAILLTTLVTHINRHKERLERIGIPMLATG
jgi:hypothetical protein